MASVILILDLKGAPLISRAYRGDIVQNCAQVFTQKVLDADEPAPPVFEHEGHTYIFSRVNNIFILAVSKINVMPALLLTYIKRMVEVFNGYFGMITEESVRDNFVIIYELLDEMMDFGYPQYTETKILKEFITQEGFKLQIFDDDQLEVKALPAAVTGAKGASTMRTAGIKYKKNEVFLDVVERVNLLVGQDGETLQSEIQGAVKMRVYLTGMPELKLGLNDKVLFDSTGKKAKGKTIELEDVKFHQCVRLNRFESDRTISFIPPDGDFELMMYRLNTKVKPLIHVEVQVVRHGTSRVEMLLKARSTYKKTSSANFVDILIPVPVDAENAQGKANSGTVRYAPEREAILWNIKAFPGGREFMCRCSYTVPSVRASDPNAISKKPISVNFEIPYFTVSGFQVRYLKVTERSNYEALPWVRYVTHSGEYQIRTT